MTTASTRSTCARVRARLEQQRKLVPAHPRDQLAGTQAAAQALRQHPQQLVREIVPVHVVHELEAVDVQRHEQERRVLPRLAQHLRHEHDPVGQAGQHVRQAPTFEFLHLPLDGLLGRDAQLLLVPGEVPGVVQLGLLRQVPDGLLSQRHGAVVQRPHELRVEAADLLVVTEAPKPTAACRPCSSRSARESVSLIRMTSRMSSR